MARLLVNDPDFRLYCGDAIDARRLSQLSLLGESAEVAEAGR